ncbi:MAG: type II secretion system F family protein [Candidatus Omnitrophica bacterium]|nr:type II secretion system F family protein [Candidatus Omnitrophota bacterium]
MPTFIYKAKRGPEKVESGEVSAISQDEALVKIEAMGLSPITIVEKEGSSVPVATGTAAAGTAKARARGAGAPHSEIPTDRASGFSSGFARIGTKHIDAFTWQLASLIKASVPMLKALSLISQQTESRALKAVVDDLYNQIKNGRTLSDGMRKYPHLFNNLYLSMIKSGEQGGVLHEVLYKIAEYREKEQVVLRKIQAALAYPAVMVVVGAGTVFIMLTFFMPKFIGIFKTMKQTLPVPTMVLIGISNFMSANWLWILIAFLLVLVVFGRVKSSSRKKFLLDLVKLHIPFINKFVRNAEIAKLARTLGLLLKSGLSIHDSLSLATDTLDNEALRNQLRRVSDDIVQQGATLSSSLARVKVFPTFALNMIAVGEESGKLEESLSGIANAYEKEVEQTISVMTSLLEPLLILVIGGVVGFIVFALLLPIFNIGTMSR